MLYLDDRWLQFGWAKEYRGKIGVLVKGERNMLCLVLGLIIAAADICLLELTVLYLKSDALPSESRAKKRDF